MIEYEDIKQLQSEFDERYVLQTDCNDNKAHLNKKFANDDKRIEIISHDFGTLKKLLWIIASASVTSAVAVVFDIIMK
jgi:hypothetical protein